MQQVLNPKPAWTDWATQSMLFNTNSTSHAHKKTPSRCSLYNKTSHADGKTPRRRRSCVPLPPTQREPGEELKYDKQRIAFLINERQQTGKFHSIWSSSGWGCVQSSPAILCHMVSLIAVFQCDREVHQMRKTPAPNTGAKVLMWLWAFTSSLSLNCGSFENIEAL